MKRPLKFSLVVSVLIISVALIFIALSDDVFFTAMKLKSDDAVTDLEGEGYELAFYMYGNSQSERQVKIATVFHNVAGIGDNLAHITFRLIPEDNMKVDSLHLEFMMLQPTSAFMLENPYTGQSNTYVYTRTDKDTSVILDFRKLDTKASEMIIIDSWLDTVVLEDVTEDKLLVISFSIFEESIFRAVRYEAYTALNIKIPDISL
ncbi:MAG: hypothetical protein JSV32_00475 [Dehalococcoidia bacterium]|nr:MAG: hypothetical protein JSV32_00475 [Dehalococcoidia bacterium]